MNIVLETIQALAKFSGWGLVDIKICHFRNADSDVGADPTINRDPATNDVFVVAPSNPAVVKCNNIEAIIQTNFDLLDYIDISSSRHFDNHEDQDSCYERV